MRKLEKGDFVTDGGDDAGLEHVLLPELAADDLVVPGVGGPADDVPHVSGDHGEGEDQGAKGPDHGVLEVLGEAGGQQLEDHAGEGQEGNGHQELGVLGGLDNGDLGGEKFGEKG